MDIDIEMNIKMAIERLKLCSTNQCNICGRYEKEECMLERNRCERTVLNELEKKSKIIDEMAEYIYEDLPEFGIFKDINTPEKIKEYFTNKAENVGE